jgi:hypothetical protein
MDFTRYEFTLDCDHPDWIADKRHVEIIHQILIRNDFKRVAELGSYTGFSTAAFIEALNQGKDFKLHIIDPCPTKQLRTLISMCKKPQNVILHTQKGEDVLAKWRDFDFVFVDADHSIKGAGADLLMLLRNETPNIMAHDTNLFNIGNNQGEGSDLIGRVLSSHKDYMCIEDKKQRPNELTDRGLFFASREKEKHKIAEEVFKELC